MRIRTKIIPLTSKKISSIPEVNFIVAVFREAWCYALSPRPKAKVSHPVSSSAEYHRGQCRNEAIKFFESTDEEWADSFQFFCDLLNLDSNYIKKIYHLYKKNPVGNNADEVFNILMKNLLSDWENR